ncbi:hypothetical protein C8R45DRAFT_942820 [Mycena sanguinolenta]|nr:hypothetical protein C8R45DRAFT_942820 [Mycena sanguinolenta]
MPLGLLHHPFVPRVPCCAVSLGVHVPADSQAGGFVTSRVKFCYVGANSLFNHFWNLAMAETKRYTFSGQDLDSILKAFEEQEHSELCGVTPNYNELRRQASTTENYGYYGKLRLALRDSSEHYVKGPDATTTTANYGQLRQKSPFADGCKKYFLDDVGWLEREARNGYGTRITVPYYGRVRVRWGSLGCKSRSAREMIFSRRGKAKHARTVAVSREFPGIEAVHRFRDFDGGEIHRATAPPAIPVSSSSASSGAMATAEQSTAGAAAGGNEISQAVENRERNIFAVASNAVKKPLAPGIKFERDINRIEDGVTKLKGVASTMTAIVDNDGVQQIGKAILNGVPALMKILETMSKAHPFAQLAFEPFKWAYNQELKRRDNETTSRLSLFESIKNVMLISIEMKDIVASDDQQQDPEGNQIPSRLAEIGRQMKDDIYGCYAALDAMQKQSLFIRFCYAGAWKEQLQAFKDAFKTRQDGLIVALNLYTARTVHKIRVIREVVIKGPIVVTTLHDRQIEAFYRSRGGEEEVFKDDKKCRELLKLQNELTGTHNIQIIAAGGNKQRGIGVADTEKTSQSKNLKENLGDHEAINQLRKERQNDVATAIQQNIQSFKKYWNLTLNRLSDDINQNTHREANRIIGSMIGQWHRRIEDKIMRHVWRDQVCVPLPDSWTVDYLEAKRLRYLQPLSVEIEALDPDTSGLSTINELSAWLEASVLVIRTAKIEIDQSCIMVLIREKVGISMPGNKIHVNDYILRIWPLVHTLTSGLERFDGSDWLAEQFQNYINEEETKLQSGLKAIHYHIDSMEMVNELLAGNRIERRHTDTSRQWIWTGTLNGFRVVCSGVGCIPLVVFRKLTDAAEYYEWKDWSNDAYYKSNEVFVYSGGNEIMEVDKKELESILLYDAIPNAPKEITPQTDNNDDDSHIRKLQEAMLNTCSSGAWFGFHCTEPEVPRSGMTRLNLKALAKPDEANTLTISGEGNDTVDGSLTTIDGQLNAAPGDQEQQQFPFNFTQTFSFDAFTYRGVFDVERQIINGTFETGSDSGSFFFKKTPAADIMCYRPLRVQLKPAELWSFLSSAVLGARLRQRPSMGYLAAPVKMIRRALELLSSIGKPAVQDEAGEFGRLRKEFTPSEWLEVVRLSNWYDRVGDLQPKFWCDSCGELITRTRVICMDCERPGNTIDFDTKESCVVISPLVCTGLSVPHDRTHTLVKTRDIVLPNDFPAHRRRARHCATIAAGVFPAIHPDSKPTIVSTTLITEEPLPGRTDNVDAPDPVPTPKIQDAPVGEDARDGRPIAINCLICEKPVSAPCCEVALLRFEPLVNPEIRVENDAFICLSCETRIDDLLPWDFQKRYREEAKTPEKHNVFHLLIRFDVAPAAPSENTAVPNIEEEMERRLRSLQQGLLARMDEDKAQLEARLAKMEAHLQAIVATLDV